jgi:sugar phosphate isomerase/epimerase
VQTQDTIEAVKILSDVTSCIELTGGCLYDPQLREKLITIKRQQGLRFLVHSYFPPPPDHIMLNFADSSDHIRRFITEAMTYVSMLEVPYYSIHGGFRRAFKTGETLLFRSGDDSFAEEDMQRNIHWFLNTFSDHKLVLENLYPINQDSETCFFMHIDEITRLLEAQPDIYLLLDLGHLKISSELLHFKYRNAVDLLLEKYNKRIREIHVSENDGKNDVHWNIGADSAQYQLLRKCAALIKENNINVTIEARNISLQSLRSSFNLLRDIWA